MRPPQQYPRSAVLATAAALVVGAFGVALPLSNVQLDRAAHAANGVDTSSQRAYIRSVAPMAQAAHVKYGVPASVSIAQSILESGWGKSTLTTQHHAYFGIKCSKSGDYATGCVNMRTREYDGRGVITDGFRTYARPLDSFLDHGQFLRINSRYAAAFKYPRDANQFLREVHRAGYATDPTYSSMVIGIMRDYNLYAYDKGTTTSASARPTTASAKPTTASAKPTTASATPTPTPTRTATATPSVTPSRTATPSPTPTRTATATPSATPSRTATPSVTPSRTATPSATPSRTATPSVTPSRTATPRVTASATALPESAPVTPTQPKDPNVLEIPKRKDVVVVPVAAPRDQGEQSAKDESGGLAKTGA